MLVLFIFKLTFPGARGSLSGASRAGRETSGLFFPVRIILFRFTSLILETFSDQRHDHFNNMADQDRRSLNCFQLFDTTSVYSTLPKQHLCSQKQIKDLKMAHPRDIETKQSFKNGSNKEPDSHLLELC